MWHGGVHADMVRAARGSSVGVLYIMSNHKVRSWEKPRTSRVVFARFKQVALGGSRALQQLLSHELAHFMPLPSSQRAAEPPRMAAVSDAASADDEDEIEGSDESFFG